MDRKAVFIPDTELIEKQGESKMSTEQVVKNFDSQGRVHS